MAAPAKSVLITGAAQGLGQAIAFRLAADGFKVALNDINVEELQKSRDTLIANGHKVIAVAGDVSVDEDVQRVIAQTVAEFGRLDVMIANAAVVHVGPLLETAIEDIDRVLAVNVRGVFLCYKYAAKQMIAQGDGGKLIGVSSAAGSRGFPYISTYSASKFAIRGLSESAALELGRYGITVNCFSPGDMDTPTLRKEIGKFGGFETFCASESKLTPLGRMTVSEDVTNVVSFLSSDASNWINGQLIGVDGGRSLTGVTIG